MSLGGYKFRGYCVNRGSTTNGEWVELIHRARTKAFIQASVSANAGWTPTTDGNTSFETYGNILHHLSGMNWITIFTNGTDSLAIVTLAKYCFGGGTASSDTVQVTNYRDYGSTGYKYFCPLSSCTHVVRQGLGAMTESDVLTGGNGVSQLLPIGAPVTIAPSSGVRMLSDTAELLSSSVDMGYTTITLSSYYSRSSLYFGYAIKGKNIVTITKYSSASRSPQITLISLDAYSSKVNQDDSDGFLYINLSGVSVGDKTVYEEYSIPSESEYCWSDPSVWFNVGNVRYPAHRSSTTDAKDVWLYFYGKIIPTMAQFTGSTIEYPFSSIFVWGASQSTNCNSKGMVSIDYLAYNCAMTYSIGNVGDIVANGKYLIAFTVQNSSSSRYTKWMPSFFPQSDLYFTQITKHTFYVGWDPSNPDIMQSSSWTEYTE